MKRIFSYLPISIVTVVACITILPLLHSGFFPIHDDTQVQRVYEMAKALRTEPPPIRWVSDLGYGYGYPIFNFYAPLAYYVGGFFVLIGVNALIATKLMIGIGMAFAAYSMYLLGRSIWGQWGGVLSSMLYSLAPYHALDLYVRGDVAELYAYAFFPLIFLGLWHVYKKQNSRGVVIGSIGYAGTILSHNLSALMVTPFVVLALVVFSLVSIKQKQKQALIGYASIVLIGVGLSAFYWLPVLSEMKYTNVLSQVGGGADFRDHFVCLPQLWDSPWGFGGSAKGCIDGMSYRIGKLHIILLVISLVSAIFVVRKQKEKAIIAVSGIAFSLLSCFFLLPFAQPVWEILKPMAFFQYPWRFLLMIAFFGSLSAGFIGYLLAKQAKYLFGILVMGGVILISLVLYPKLFSPHTYLLRTPDFYTNRVYLQWDTSQISDEYMPKGFDKPKMLGDVPHDKFIIVSGEGTANTLVDSVGYTKAHISAITPVTVEAHIAYFPAWHLGVMGKELGYTPTNSGLRFTLPAGDHYPIFHFSQTPVEQGANMLSLISFGLLVTGIIYSRKYGRADKKTS